MSTPGHRRSMPTADILVNTAVLGRYLELKNLDRALLPLVELIPRDFSKENGITPSTLNMA